MMLTLIKQQEAENHKWNKQETEHVQGKSKCGASYDIHINGRRVYIL